MYSNPESAVIPDGPKFAPMQGVSDGSRLLAILSEHDFADSWQRRQDKSGTSGGKNHDLGVNLYYYATGRNALKSRMRPAVTRASTVWNSPVRWCKAGRDRISRTDSGSGVGPGV